jgi:MFS family permease
MIAEPPPAPPAPEAAEPRVWRVGTLVYNKRGLTTLLCWLLWGDFAWSLRERGIGKVASLLLKKFGASDLMVGLLVGSLPAAIGMVLGPIISMKSDRHRGRWGRRIPFLLIPTPILVLSLVGMAFAAHLGETVHGALGTSSPGVSVCQLVTFAVFLTLFEICSVTANSLFVALINDVVPQELIGRTFSLFRIVSLFAGILFFSSAMEHAEANQAVIFLGIALIFGGGFTLMCLLVREGQYPPPPAPTHRGGPLGPALTYLRECFSHRYYLLVFTAMTFGMLAQGPVNSFSVLYAKSLGMNMGFYGKCLALTYAISLVASFPLGWLADRFHPLRVGLVVLVLYAAFTLAGGFLAITPASFAICFIIHGVLTGAYLTGTAALAQRLFPREKFGQFNSAWGLLSALSYGLLPPIIGATLDATGHNYRLTFFAGSILAFIAAATYLLVNRRFDQMGGPTGYVAPE